MLLLKTTKELQMNQAQTLKQYVFIITLKEVKWASFENANTLVFGQIDDSGLVLYRAGQLLFTTTCGERVICKFDANSLDQAKESLESLLETFYFEVAELDKEHSVNAAEKDVSVDFREISIEEMQEFLTGF